MKSLAVLFLLILVCCTPVQKPLSQVVFDNSTLFNVELAMTDAEREQGLMYRTSLPQKEGMLFIFGDEQPRSFWMKNTKIPLDMIFADQDGKVVGIVADAKPYSEKTVGPGVPSQYVLEVNGGFCRRHGVAVGDWLRFSGFTPQATN